MREKKVIILAMTCNQEFFIKEADVLRYESFGKDVISGKFGETVDFWTYSASNDDKVHINKNKHHIAVPCDDGINNTLWKTILTLQTLDYLYEDYDYIFRTNCSTYINVRLLREFVNSIPEEDSNKIFTHCVYSSKDVTGPYENACYPSGSCMLFPKFWCDVLKNVTKESFEKMKPYNLSPKNTENEDECSCYNIDDNAIGFIFNLYAIKNNMLPWKIYKSFIHINNRWLVPNLINHISGEDYYLGYISLPVRIYNKPDRTDEYDMLIKYNNYYNNVWNKVDNGDISNLYLRRGTMLYNLETNVQVITKVDYNIGKAYPIVLDKTGDYQNFNKDKYNSYIEQLTEDRLNKLYNDDKLFA